MVKKEFIVSSTHTYKVRIEYDETKYSGSELAVAAIQYIDADHPAICDEGDQDLSAVWSVDIPPDEMEEAVLSVRELLDAGVDEEDMLEASCGCPLFTSGACSKWL
jgi:hypothetical protein